MADYVSVSKRDVLMFCWYQVTLPGSRPVSSILNHSALVGSYWSHVVFPHDAMYVMMGPMLCGHCTQDSDPSFSPSKIWKKTHVGAVAIFPQKLYLTSRVRIRNERGFLCVLAAV